MKKQLIKDNAARTLEKIRLDQSLSPRPVSTPTPSPQPSPMVQDNNARDRALEQSIAREKEAQDRASASQAQANREQQARDNAFLVQLRTSREESAREISRLQDEKARVDQELQARTANEQRVQQELDQLKLQVAALHRGQANQPEHKAEVPPAYAEREHRDDDHAVTITGELPENTEG